MSHELPCNGQGALPSLAIASATVQQSAPDPGATPFPTVIATATVPRSALVPGAALVDTEDAESVAASIAQDSLNEFGLEIKDEAGKGKGLWSSGKLTSGQVLWNYESRS